jgi:hypothetical protein
MRFPPTHLTIKTVVAVAASALLTGCGATAGSTPPPAAEGAGPTPGPTSSAVLASDYEAPVLAGWIRTVGIKESSGLSASECQDVLWTHNDSGNDPLIYALSTSGEGLGTWRVQGARNTDWESIATYKDPSGSCALILGDIGDNDARRLLPSANTSRTCRSPRSPRDS